MSNTTAITAHVDPGTLALVDRVAGSKGVSRAEFVAGAIRRVAESEADFLEFIQTGIDDLDKGRFVSHEELIAQIRARTASRRGWLGDRQPN